MLADEKQSSDTALSLAEKLMAAVRETADPPLLLDARKAQRLLGVGKSSFYRLLSADQIPAPVNLPGAGPRWRRADLERWVSQLKGRRRTPTLVGAN